MDGKKVEERPISPKRKAWIVLVWVSPGGSSRALLHFIGRMQASGDAGWPRVRSLFSASSSSCSTRLHRFLDYLAPVTLICPNWDKAWSRTEVSTHKGESDFWVSLHGKVYDISNFWRLPHSDTAIQTTSDLMRALAGRHGSLLLCAPLQLTCPRLFKDDNTLQLLSNNTGNDHPEAKHVSGNHTAMTLPPSSRNARLVSRFSLPACASTTREISSGM